MKKILTLALFCAILVSCDPNNQYQVMFEDGEITWANNDSKIDVPSGDTVVIKNFVGMGRYELYSKYTVWGLYKGVIPSESVDTDSKGDRRSRTWYRKAIVIK